MKKIDIVMIWIIVASALIVIGFQLNISIGWVITLILNLMIWGD